MSDYKYTLIKGSAPGFELKSNDIGDIYKLLDSHICSSCKTTKSQEAHSIMSEWPEIKDNYDPSFTKIGSDGLEYIDMDEVIKMETAWSLPDNYDDLSRYAKVKHLLHTGCGASFTLLEGDETLDSIYAPSSAV